MNDFLLSAQINISIFTLTRVLGRSKDDLINKVFNYKDSTVKLIGFLSANKAVVQFYENIQLTDEYKIVSILDIYTKQDIYLKEDVLKYCKIIEEQQLFNIENYGK